MTSEELFVARKVCEAAAELRRVWESGNEPSQEECVFALGAVLATTDRLRELVNEGTVATN